jgi:hypothetical protein
MKKLITTISIVTACVSLGLAQGKAQQWIVKITPATTVHYLDSTVTALKAEKVYLKFEGLKFESKKLIKIKASVNMNTPTGTPSASFSSDNLVSYMIMIDKNPDKVSVQGK